MNYVRQGFNPIKYAIDKYKTVFCTNVKAQLAYRGIIFESIFNYIMECILLVFLWKAIYSGSQILYGRSFTQMKGYLLASCSFSSFYSYPSIHFLSTDIRNGEIAYTLTRPIDFQMQFFFKNLGRIVSSILMIIPIFFILSFFSKSMPSGNLIYGFFSLLMGIFLCISFDFFLGILCFWAENSWGISLARQVALQYLSGAFVPLDCFPPQVTTILRDFFPFSGIVYFPVQFLTGSYPFSYFLSRMVFQTAWFLFFLILGRAFYLVARKKATVNGG